MSSKEHWQSVYLNSPADKLGWFAPHLRTSIDWIDQLALSLAAPILDAGGGASTLVDDLLRKGYRDISVLDISDNGLATAKDRLGTDAPLVSWFHGDVLELNLPENRFELWHDRAAFHFLLSAEEIETYVEKVRSSLKLGGSLIVATFHLEAPSKCSGLPVQRYGVDLLKSTFGSSFTLVRHQLETHQTPAGVEQRYVYCQFRRAT